MIIFPKRGYFKRGDKGANVKAMQKMLNHANKGAYYSIAEDGVYGEKTEAYVRLLEDVRHLVKDGQFGEKCMREAEKTITKPMKAINWAVSIARNNSFAYGTGKRAHRGGCYFCGTNTGKVLWKKERKGEPHYVKDSNGKKHTYEKTYCCNPFIFSAYAHGTKIERMLKMCQRGKNDSTGMNPRRWAAYGFTNIGRCNKMKFDDLKKGDIIMFSAKGKGHVWMYTGGDWLVEASGGTWGARSISHKKGARKRFATYKTLPKAYVVRCK